MPKMCNRVPKNVQHGANNLRHGAKNVSNGGENVHHVAKNPQIPQSPNPPVPKSPIQWNTIKALGRDKIANRQTHRQTDRHINTMNWPGLRASRIEKFSQI